MICPECKAEIPEGVKYCPECGADTATLPETQIEAVADSIPLSDTKVWGMGWYKFLIWFALFAGALLNVVQGAKQVLGLGYPAMYGYSAKEMGAVVYAAFPQMHAVDIMYGILLIALAVFGVYTRFRLSSFKANGPKCLNLVYILGFALTLLYTVLSTVFVGESTFTASFFGSVIGTGVMLAININYFGHRKHMFVN